MPGDAELERLKKDQDRAFDRKQNAWQAQDKAWNRRSAVREAMDRAYHDKQAAYDVQDASWQAYQQIRSYNGPRIDSLNSQQETAYRNMCDAFENANSAYNDHDGEAAKSYADDGHRYKAEAQEAVAERRRLVDEIREARAQHDATRPAFQRAKQEFDQVRDEHKRAKADHEQKQDEFRRAKADFDKAKDAFQARLEVLRAESNQRKSDKRSAAERAGVPSQYWDNVWVSTDSDGTVNIYFGGVGKPNGPGHGHYAMDRSGNVTYQREPYDPHGSQNFTDTQRGTLYDRSVSSENPAGGRGGYDFQDQEGHATQYYEDGTRVSWDLDKNGETQNRHWTDQNINKGRNGRHDPPPHAQ